VRESDGLALSSRNKYLDATQRAQATVLHRALGLAQERVRTSGRDGVGTADLERELKTLITGEPQARVDYIAFFDGRTLQPVDRVRRGVHLALAVFVGTTRLIDNRRL
jgi:pantoate--beta-alanine ligase